MKVNEGYESLVGVLQRALDQAQNGKGHERHANALPFDQQPMQTIAAQVGVGFLTGQAIKKAQESASLKPGADIAELLGAINYLAGAVIFIESQRQPAKERPHAIFHLHRVGEASDAVLKCAASFISDEIARRGVVNNG